MTRARDLAAFVSNADGDIKFDTDTLFIDSSANRVGIGTTTPDVDLSIAGSSASSQVQLSGSDTSKYNRIYGDNAGIMILSADAGNTAAGSSMRFNVDATERMRIDSSGRLGIKTTSPVAPLHVDSDNGFGNILLSRDGGAGGRRPFGIGITGSADADLTISASADTDQAGAFDSDRVEIVRFLSGGGITFNGDTAAANALDDYEEGTYTVTATPSGSGSLTVDSNFNTLAYTKVGRLVTVSGSIDISAVSSPTGYINISLPFSGTSGLNQQAGRASGSLTVYNVSSNNTADFKILYVSGSTFRIYVGDGTSINSDAAQQMTSSTVLAITFSYLV